MIKYTNEEGHNLLFNAVKHNTKEVLELTWTEIKQFFNKSELVDCLKFTNNYKENILHALVAGNDEEKLEYFWAELKKYFSNSDFQELINQKASENVLYCAAKFDKLEFFWTFWKLLLMTFENIENLKDLIMDNEVDEENFIHFLVHHNKTEILEFTINSIKSIFNKMQLEEILNSTGELNKSLLQSAARHNESLKVHQILWKVFRENFDDSQMFDIIKHNDEIGCNILIDATKENTEEIVMFIWNQMREILIHAEHFNQNMSDECEQNLMTLLENPSDDEIMETMKIKWNQLIKEFEIHDSQIQMERILNNELSGKDVKNLHRLALCNKLEQHDALWQILFDSIENKEELKKFVLRRDLNKNNFLHLLVLNDNPYVLEFTLILLKAKFSDEQFQEIMQSKGQFGRSLQQIAKSGPKNIKMHQILLKINQMYLKFLKFVSHSWLFLRYFIIFFTVLSLLTWPIIYRLT